MWLLTMSQGRGFSICYFDMLPTTMDDAGSKGALLGKQMDQNQVAWWRKEDYLVHIYVMFVITAGKSCSSLDVAT